MNRSKTIEKLKEKFLKEVFSVFNGMDEEYQAIINKYKTAKFVKSGTYSTEYLQQLRGETIDEVHELLSRKGAIALTKLSKIDEDYTPKPEPKELPSTTEEKILMQLERNNNLLQVKARIESSEDKRKAYKDTYTEFKDDEFVLQYLDNLSHGLKQHDRDMIIHELDKANANPFSSEINKIKLSLKTLVSPSTTMYPSYLDTGIEKDAGSLMKFRNIGKDLDTEESLREGWHNQYTMPSRR